MMALSVIKQSKYITYFHYDFTSSSHRKPTLASNGMLVKTRVYKL